jgi:hypothetical protein
MYLHSPQNAVQIARCARVSEAVVHRILNSREGLSAHEAALETARSSR